ncbi:hypothetical protein Lwor_1139 [Legionella worsleiensis]|uniref:Uncharacterized protein n=1 Tax=Legionella worsleiensis TaxID=45076 RepID=A0A0W1AFT3_9GAMM|nr:hypothetical protein Lwor_1139 [Legionella worsleiensis]
MKQIHQVFLLIYFRSALLQIQCGYASLLLINYLDESFHDGDEIDEFLPYSQVFARHHLLVFLP